MKNASYNLVKFQEFGHNVPINTSNIFDVVTKNVDAGYTYI
jgi:hypothetical protein